MVVSRTSVWDYLADRFEDEYESAVVYGDAAETEVLHEGAVRIRATGWVELPSERLLSPEAVHHIETHRGTDIGR